MFVLAQKGQDDTLPLLSNISCDMQLLFII